MTLASPTVACLFQQGGKEGAASSAIVSGGRHKLSVGKGLFLHLLDGKGPASLGKKEWRNSFNSSWDGNFKIALGPGQHTLTVSSFDAITSQGVFVTTYLKRKSPAVNLSFVVASGHSYMVNAVINYNSEQWSYTIVDGTDKDHPEIVPVVATIFKSPIHDAAADGDVEMVRSLLKDDPDLVFGKSAITGGTALHFAAASGHKDVVELLLANKAEVNSKDGFGRTPYSLAVFGHQKDVAKLLHQHGGRLEHSSSVHY
jgi:hypothetical protein